MSGGHDRGGRSAPVDAAPASADRYLRASARWLRATEVRLVAVAPEAAEDAAQRPADGPADVVAAAARQWWSDGAPAERNSAVLGTDRVEFAVVDSAGPTSGPDADGTGAEPQAVLVVIRAVRRPRPALQAERIAAVAALAGQLLATDGAAPLAADGAVRSSTERAELVDGVDAEPTARARLSAHIDRAGAGAVFVVGVDRLAVVNEVFGRSGGDEVLAALSERLAAWAGPAAVLSRLSGTRVGVARTDIVDADAAVRAAEDLRDILSAPVTVHGLSVSRSVSVGVAICDGSHRTDVVAQAVRGSLAARESGGDAVSSYDEGATEERQARLRLELELDHALRTGQLRLYYQPEFDLRTGSLLAVEALLRWQHPRLGLVRADAFVGDTERTRTFADVQMWVVEQACGQLASWQARPGKEGLGLRINVSAWQIGRGDIAEQLLACLAEHRVPHDTVCVELTERRMPRHADQIVEPLRRLADAGVSIAIDDFGTGQGTMSQLTTLPVDTLKIDQSFVTAMRHDERADAIVGGIISLANSLTLETVAEGVDGADTAARLVQLGCTRGQGNSLGEAMPASAVDALLARR